MKKIISLTLVVLMALCAFVACGTEDTATTAAQVSGNATEPGATEPTIDEPVVETLNFGMGTYTVFGEVKNADGEANGSGEVTATVAAVLVDKDGKIVKCDIDCVDISVAYTSAGVADVADEFATKAELGTAYGMAAYGTDLNNDGKVLEWNEQIDIFEEKIVGKTIDEAKALVVNGYQAVEEVQTAGCTMGVGDYIKAVEKAVANATESAASATDTLKVSVVTAVDAKDATADTAGAIELEINMAAAAVADGKVTATAVDVAAANFTFDVNGVATTDATTEIVTKLELGTAYGMAAYGTDLNNDGKVLEWNEQAAVFTAACLGKTADEIAALVVNGYQAVEEVQTAGCTMGVADIAAAIVKAAK
ncbi:MAG: hypothetical protein IJC81_02745 [Clostridia bacterium]|nr:hypothetical protein [Clostridia bacterium]